jgi:hypothetical protein
VKIGFFSILFFIFNLYWIKLLALFYVNFFKKIIVVTVAKLQVKLRPSLGGIRPL